VRFVLDKVALGQVPFAVLQFPPSVSFHQCSILIHVPLTLYNVFLPVLQFPLLVSFHQCSILIHSSTTTLYNVFLPVLQFPLSVSFHHCSILIHLPPTLYNVFLPVLQFRLSVSFHHRFIFIHLPLTHSQHFRFPISVSFHRHSIHINSSVTDAVYIIFSSQCLGLRLNSMINGLTCNGSCFCALVYILITRARRVLRFRLVERPPARRVIANILKKQSWTAEKGWSSSLGVGRGANNSSP
jgi:hypothetical protein